MNGLLIFSGKLIAQMITTHSPQPSEGTSSCTLGNLQLIINYYLHKSRRKIFRANIPPMLASTIFFFQNDV